MIQPGQLERARQGGAVTAEIFNGPVDVLNRMRGAGPANQVIPSPRLEGGGAGVIDTFEVMIRTDPAFAEDDEQPMHDDWFYAKRLSTGETRIKMAKPHKLRKTPWDKDTRRAAGKTEKVQLDAFDVLVEYDYFPNTGTGMNVSYKRHAIRDDEPNIRERQLIWPEYVTFAHPNRGEDFFLAAQIGEEATMIDGVEWQDLNDSGREWTVLPQAFESDE